MPLLTRVFPLQSGKGRLNLEIKAVNPVDDTEIKFKGIEALNKVLGPSAALRFLTLLHREPTDYVEISRRLQTIEDIFKRVKKQKKGQSIVNDKRKLSFRRNSATEKS